MDHPISTLIQRAGKHLAERLTTTTLKGDIFGGVTTAIVSLPLALTFGMMSGAGAEAGLYGAILVGLCASLFGSSRTLISEPTGPMTVIMTTVIMGLVQTHGKEAGLAMAFAVVVVAGISQILFGLLRIGKYVTIMPYSVISGFMSGIGVLLILMQLPPLLGHGAPTGGALGVLQALPSLLGGIHWAEAGLGVAALVLLFCLPRKWRRWMPPQLLVLIVGSLAAATLLAGTDLRRIGAIPTSLPDFQLPLFTAADLTRILLDGVVLGMLGCIDCLLTAMIADSLTREHHDPNRELVGQGIGNMVAGLFGGLPGAGATMGTVVSIQSGARSPLAGLLRAGILFAVMVAIAPWLEGIPYVILAAIALKVGIDILDWSFLRRAHSISWSATAIMYSVLLLTVLVDLVVAVGVGVFIANMITIERLSKLAAAKIKVIGTTGDGNPLPPAEEALLARTKGRLVLLQLSGPMIFGVAKAIARESEALEDADILVLDVSDVPMLTTTVALALENMVREASTKGYPVFLVGASGQVLDRLRDMKLLQENYLRACDSRLEALERALKALESRPVNVQADPETMTYVV